MATIRNKGFRTAFIKVHWYITISSPPQTSRISCRKSAQFEPRVKSHSLRSGICRPSYQLDECVTRSFKAGSGSRALAQTRPAASKMPGSRRHSPQKGCF